MERKTRMNKSELVTRLSEVQEIPAHTADKIINLIFGNMAEELIAGGRIEIRGLGCFDIKNYDGYNGRNPKTGEVVTVNPKKLVRFKTGKELKERVMAG